MTDSRFPNFQCLVACGVVSPRWFRYRSVVRTRARPSRRIGRFRHAQTVPSCATGQQCGDVTFSHNANSATTGKAADHSRIELSPRWESSDRSEERLGFFSDEMFMGSPPQAALADQLKDAAMNCLVRVTVVLLSLVSLPAARTYRPGPLDRIL